MSTATELLHKRLDAMVIEGHPTLTLTQKRVIRTIGRYLSYDPPHCFEMSKILGLAQLAVHNSCVALTKKDLARWVAPRQEHDMIRFALTDAGRAVLDTIREQLKSCEEPTNA